MQTKTQNEKAGFGSKLGFILATADPAAARIKPSFEPNPAFSF